jgi:Na+/melibiose symporter-like transporter
MKQQKISPIVFIIIGAIVTGVSFTRESLLPFIYVGIIFIAYGGIRMLFSFLTKKRDKKPVEKKPSLKEQIQPQQHSQKKQYEKPQHVLPIHYHPQTSYHYVICPNCSYHMHTSYRYCPRCGYEVPTK